MTSVLTYTPVEDIPRIHADLRRAFRTGKSKPVAFRKEQILQLSYLLQENIQRIRDAMHADIGRADLETDFFDIGPVLNQANLAFNNVEKWASPEKRPFSATWTVMSPAVRKEPKGVVLIIGPFNLPIFTAVGPLLGALASGCAAVVKMPEQMPHFSALFAELVPQYLDKDLYRVVNGAVPETTKLLELQWDHICYTGNGRVGRIIATAAAQHLTPVTLELGGKSPVVIDPRCDLQVAARRILWGKQANAGQVCIAPDYVLIPKSAEEEFVTALKNAHAEFYPKGAAESETFGRIVTEQHALRIQKLLTETKGTIVIGGEVDIAQKYVAPTVVINVKDDDALMQDEIFGPVLPIMTVEDVDEAINYINDHDHPLALYVFTPDAAFKAKVFDNTLSGACAANDVIIHGGAAGMPFGGVGASGSGNHSSKYSFDMFTHLRPTLDNPNWVDKVKLSVRFPPYDNKKATAYRGLSLPNFPPPRGARKWSLWWVVLFAAAISAWVKKRRIV